MPNSELDNRQRGRRPILPTRREWTVVARFAVLALVAFVIWRAAGREVLRTVAVGLGASVLSFLVAIRVVQGFSRAAVRVPDATPPTPRSTKDDPAMAHAGLVGSSPNILERAGGGQKQPRERLYRILAETEENKPLQIPHELAPWVKDWLKAQPTPKVVREIIELRNKPKPANISPEHISRELRRDYRVSKRAVYWVCKVFGV